MFKIIALALSLLLCPFFALTAEARELTVNKIAALVNGEMITLHDLRTQTMAELSRRRMAPDDPQAGQVMRGMLDMMINDILLRQEAAKYKVSITAGEVDAEMQNILKGNKMTQADFEKQLAKQGTGVQLFKEKLKDTLLRRRMIAMMISKKVVVTKEEVAAYYEAHKDEFAGRKYADFSVIVLTPKDKYQRIYNDIKTGKVSFEEAATKFSKDSTAGSGGYVGRVPWNSIPEKVRGAFSSASDGQLLPPVLLEGNPVIFKLHSTGDAPALTLEQAAPRIEEMLKEPRMQERFTEYAQQLRAKAVIDIRM